MEDRQRTRRRANQVRAGLQRAPRDRALGMPAQHTHPGGRAASRARGTHSLLQCHGPFPSMLQHMLPLLSPSAISCVQAALQLARARSRERSLSLRSALRGSGAPRLLNHCAVPHLDVCSGAQCSRQQSAAATPAASLAQSVASRALSLHVAPAARGCQHPPSTP